MTTGKPNLKFSTQKDDSQNPQAARQQAMAADEKSIVKIFEDVMASALAMHATELHFEPYGAQTRVRYRVGGQLIDQPALDGKMHPNIINRIKVISGIDIAKRGVALRGYFNLEADDQKLELKSVITPTNFGDKAFIQIQYQSAFSFTLDQLGMYPQTLALVQGLLARPNGLILVAGPPGSGRTTSCYALMSHLNQADRFITTMEQQIRYQLPGIVQGKPDARYNHTFVDGLRAAIEMEPDGLYISDLNNDEAARLALGAAFGRRTVVGRINASNGATALLALMDMGLPGFLVASGVTGVISQRIVKRLCERCREPYRPKPQVLTELGIQPEANITFYAAKGCEQCQRTGFSGMMGVYEVLVPNERVQERLIARAPAQEITEAAAATGLVPLRYDGLSRLSQGFTTLEEILSRL